MTTKTMDRAAIWFFRKLRTLTWKQHVCYVYRIHPRCRRCRPGRYNFLAKYTQAFTRGDLRRAHGPGVYVLWLRHRSGRGSKCCKVEE